MPCGTYSELEAKSIIYFLFPNIFWAVKNAHRADHKANYQLFFRGLAKNKAPTWKKSNFLLNIYKFFIKYIQKWTSKTEL